MIDATTAQQLLDAATPGPWTTNPERPRFIDTAVMPQIDEADWGQPTEGLPWYHIELQGDRAWRYGDVRIMAAAPDLARTVIALEAERDALRAALDEIEALNAKLLADLAEAQDSWEGGNVLDAWEAKCADVIARTRAERTPT